jgi:hypothetical protein
MSDYEREYVRAELALQQERFDRASARMQADIDLYRDDLAADYAERNRAHQARLQQIRDEQAAWLKSFINGDAAEHTDVQQPPQGASVGEPATPGAGAAGPPDHEAKLAEAARIKALPLHEYARERQRLIRANQGLFS